MKFRFNNIYAMVLALAGVLLVSCSDEIMPEGNGSPEGGVRITIRSKSLSSRAVEVGKDEYNENKIDKLYLIFNHNDESEDVEGVVRSYTDLYDPHDPGNITVGVKFSHAERMQLFPGNERTCKVYALVNCRENLTEGIKTVKDAKSYPIVKDLAPVSNEAPQPLSMFIMDGEGTVDLYDNNTDYDGRGSVDVRRVASKFNLNVTVGYNVPEYEADGITPKTDENGKIIYTDKWKDYDEYDTYKVYEADGVTVREQWIPVRDEIIAMIVNGVGCTKLGLDKDNIMPDDLQKGSGAVGEGNVYFNTSPSYHNETKLSFKDGNTYRGMKMASHGLPMYSYMNRWQWDASEDVAATDKLEDMTYFIIQLPWKKVGSSLEYRYCYYQVPASRLAYFDRNYAYTINLNLGMLGSFDVADALELTDLSYTILDWNQAPDMSADLTDIKFLVVNNPEVSVYNEEDIVIPFYSTDVCTVAGIEVSYPVFTFDGNNESTVTFGKNVIENTNDSTFFKTSIVKSSAGNNLYELHISHSLMNWLPMNSSGQEVTTKANIPNIDHFSKDSRDLSAFSKFTIKVKLQHADNSAFWQDIQIEQYPSMYIEAKETPALIDYVYINGMTGDHHYILYEYNIENKWQRYISLGGLVGELGSEENGNPNTYLITTSKLAETNYSSLGDPRVLCESDSVVNGSKLMGFPLWSTTYTNGNYEVTRKMEYGYYLEAPTTDENDPYRRIKNYYTTDIEKGTFIAPKFRIASSYGRIKNASGFTYDAAQARCAAYQENGYPAGRWRIPTNAEVKYMIELSNKRIIPSLFSDNRNYIAAGGNVPIGSPGDSNPLVRCVYDEWYWGSEQLSDKTKFTWGDEPILSPQSNVKKRK